MEGDTRAQNGWGNETGSEYYEPYRNSGASQMQVGPNGLRKALGLGNHVLQPAERRRLRGFTWRMPNLAARWAPPR